MHPKKTCKSEEEKRREYTLEPKRGNVKSLLTDMHKILVLTYTSTDSIQLYLYSAKSQQCHLKALPRYSPTEAH